MSFRNEEKLQIDKNKLLIFKKYLSQKKAIKIFKSRLVKSIYFDNKNFDMYHNSIEGIVPRKKIRIRSYPDSSKKLMLEKKISSVEGRYKTSNEIKNNSILKKGIFDNDYGKCMPVTIVNYLRSYYLIDNIRITLDENIFYNRFNREKKYTEKLIVAELKYPFNKKLSEVDNLFPFTRIRFSKYSNSVEKCY